VIKRESLLRSRNENATERGMQLFEVLCKNLGNNKITWQKQKIIVMEQLSIKPPYRMCDIKGAQHTPKLLNFVQGLVEKFNENAATGDKEDTT